MQGNSGDAASESQRPYFVRDEKRYIPNEFARGGWGQSLSGHVVGGLLGRAAEQLVDDPQFQPARLTVDLPRPAALEPVEVRTRVRQDRRRLRLVEMVLVQDHNPVAQASALFLRRGAQPDGQVWSQPVQMPPLPAEQGNVESLFVRTYGWGADIQNPEPDWAAQAPGQKYTWLRETRPLVDAEPMTAFTRAAMAGDITASIANWGDRGPQFINVDYTLTLSRLPEGPYLGLASLTHYSDGGVATGSAVLVDAGGPIGNCVSVAIAQTGFLAPPKTVAAE